MKTKILLLLVISILLPPSLSAKIIVNMVENRIIIDNVNRSVSYPICAKVRIVTNPKEKATFRVCVLQANSKELYNYDYFLVHITKAEPWEDHEWKFVNKGETFSVHFVKNPLKADFCIRYSNSRYCSYPSRSHYGLNFIVK